MSPLRVAIIFFACVLAVATAEQHPLSETFIDHINSKQKLWKAGENFPHNTPLKHLKRLLGVLPSKRVSSLPRVKHDPDLIANLPKNFDARLKWPNCRSLHEIRDQGSCGSCWAFAAVEAMTDRVCIYSNGTKQFHLSAQDLVTCCSDCGYGCGGGSPLDAWEYWVKHGLVSGGNYNSSQGCRPYSIPPCIHHAPGHKVNPNKNLPPCVNKYVKTPECSKTCDGNYSVAFKEDKVYGKNVTLILDGEDHIMAELFLYGSVEATFLVYLDFYTYKSGIYFCAEKIEEPIGMHAVKIFGWGEENGTKYWLVANSWNSGWGDNGFFKVRRGKNDCYVEMMIVAGEPLLTDK